MSNLTIEKEELINIIDDEIRKIWEKELSQNKKIFYQSEHYTQLDINLIERVTKVEKGIENILEQIKSMIELTNKRFEAMDKRFEAMDKRFEAMDKRFEAMDKRFEDMRYYTEKRFEAVDKRFEDMRHYTEKHFDEVNKKINLGYWLVGIGYTSLATLITYFSVFYK